MNRDSTTTTKTNSKKKEQPPAKTPDKTESDINPEDLLKKGCSSLRECSNLKALGAFWNANWKRFKNDLNETQFKQFETVKNECKDGFKQKASEEKNGNSDVPF
jgi:hypothetical protein